MARRKRAKSPEELLESGVIASEVQSVPLVEQCLHDMYDYGVNKNIDQAAPDVRDGLIPVRRAVVSALNDRNSRPERPVLIGSADLTGHVVGKYHPHSDTSAYGAQARLCQESRYNVPLATMQGDEGDVHGGDPAHMRYTEIMANDATMAMLGRLDSTGKPEIEEGGVPFKPNYNGKSEVPICLPAAIPCYTINGINDAIGVGIASDAPQHNPYEVLQLAIHLLQLGSGTIRNSTLLKMLPGPDLPCGSDIFDTAGGGIESYLTTGEGAYWARATYEVEEYKISRRATGSKIYFDNLPPDTSVEKVMNAIQKMQADGTLPSRFTARSHGAEGVVVDVGDYPVEDVLPYLFGRTPLQKSFRVNMVVDASMPSNAEESARMDMEVMGVVDSLQLWLSHRRTVITTVAKNRMKSLSQSRANVKARLTAVENLAEISNMLVTEDDPKQALMDTFDMTEEQARHIMERPLNSFSRLSKSKLKGELESIEGEIAGNKELISSPEMVNKELLSQLRKARDKFGKKGSRKCNIFSHEEMEFARAPKEPLVVEPPKKGFVALSARGSVRWVLSERFARDLPGDYFHRVIETTDSDSIFAVTNLGFVHKMPVEELPREATPLNLHAVKFLNFNVDEEVVGVFSGKEMKGKSLAVVTSSGRVKSIDTSLLDKMRDNKSLPVTTLKDKDLDFEGEGGVVSAFLHDPEADQEIVVVTDFPRMSIVSTSLVQNKGLRAQTTPLVRMSANAQEGVVYAGILEDGEVVYATHSGEVGKVAPSDSFRRERTNVLGQVMAETEDYVKWVAQAGNDMAVHSTHAELDEPEMVNVSDLDEERVILPSAEEVYSAIYLSAAAANEPDEPAEGDGEA